MRELIKSAKNEDREAQYLLGYCYYSGDSVEQDYKQAIEWFTKAANQNHPDAQYLLGYCFFKGLGVEKNLEQVVEWFTKAAEQGDTSAQNQLGYCYLLGEGVEKNYEHAVKWFTKAAEQNHPDAQYLLGICYSVGCWGVEENLEQAIKWWTKAAEQGDAYAQNSLGDCYLNGNGVEKNIVQATMWYDKAKKQGHDAAKKQLDSFNEIIKRRYELPTERNEVFISYTSKDERYVREMEPFLKSLTRDNKIPVWFYQRLKAGDKWEEEIRLHMSSARVAVLLVSQDFLASDFVYEVELPDLLQAAENENATILWIPINHSRVNTVPIKCKDGTDICIAKYQAVCDPIKPLQEMSSTERNKLYTKLCDEDITPKFQ